MRKWMWTALILLAVLATAELYTRTTDDFDTGDVESVLADIASAAEITLLFHGSRDADNPVFIDIRNKLRASGSPTHYIDWSAGADNRARAAANARHLGVAIGQQLAINPELTSITLVAHSAGAFVPDALCESYRAAGGNAEIRMIFLDPFQLRGLLDRGYGARHHGACADFALAIVNTTDPAPSTNAFLSQAYNIDVTNDPRAAQLDRNGHYWPVAYYVTELADLQARFSRARHEVLPRGAIEVTDY